MRCYVVLNKDGGTLKTADVKALAASIASTFKSEGHEVNVDIVGGAAISSRVEQLAASKTIECLIVGGGDGTVSLAASQCWKHHKILGVLPFGTMNFFARTLGLPLEPSAAISALAKSVPRKIDIATVNGRPFVHQVSLGIQPAMIELRSRIPYASRAGKIRASALAAVKTIIRPPSFRARLVTSEDEDNNRFSMLAVTNNLYGDGHLPFADRPDAGVLGIYVAPRLSFLQNMRLARDLAFGRWANNEHFLSATDGEIVLRLVSRARGRKMSIDGELAPLSDTLVFRLCPKELSVLMPQDA